MKAGTIIQCTYKGRYRNITEGYLYVAQEYISDRLVKIVNDYGVKTAYKRSCFKIVLKS